MPPKTTFTKDDVQRAAFSLVEKKGLKELTARNVGAKLGSSTAPVYSHFSSIDELEKQVFHQAIELVAQYSKKEYTNINFLNAGIGITLFAQEYPVLYRSIYMEQNNHAEDLVNFDKKLMKELAQEPYFENLSIAEIESVIIKVGVFIHGLCGVIALGHLKYFPFNTQDKLVKLLYDVGSTIIADAHNPHQRATMKADGKGGYLFECED